MAAARKHQCLFLIWTLGSSGVISAGYIGRPSEGIKKERLRFAVEPDGHSPKHPIKITVPIWPIYGA
jgi:hypothetical protein